MEVGIKDLHKLIYHYMDKKKPLFIHGAMGIGKSDSVRQVARKIAQEKGKEYNENGWDKDKYNLCDVRASQIEPSDLRGIPFPEGNKTKWLIPNWLPTEGEGILFVDELNLAPPSIQNSFFQLFLDRRCGDYILPNGVVMIAAGNRACFKGDLLILGETNKKIKDIKKGDFVYTKNGLEMVKEIFVNDYEGKIIKIKGRYVLPIEATVEHPILVVPFKNKDTHTTTIKEFEEERWTSALEINEEFKKGKQFMMVIPKIEGTIGQKRGFSVSIEKYHTQKQKVKRFRVRGYKGRRLYINTRIMWLLGLYVAEGWTSGTHISFGLGQHELKLIEKLKEIVQTDLKYKITESNKLNGSITISFSSGILIKAFDEWMGHGAKNKQIPSFIMNCKYHNLIKAFISGYIEGDGCIVRRKKSKSDRYTIGCSSVSKKLIVQLQLLLARLGIMGGISVIKPKQMNIRNKQYQSSQAYMLRIEDDRMDTIFKLKNKRKHHGNLFRHIFKNRILIPITQITEEYYKGKVYNFETERHTFLANNCIVHNCDKANIFPLPAPLKNRFSHVTLNHNVDDWIDWAMENGIKSDIIAFIQFKPSFLFKFDSNSKDEAFPTPRSVSNASYITDGVDDLEMEKQLVATCVGEGFAYEYGGFIELKKKVRIDDILRNPAKVQDLYGDAGLLYTLISGLAEKYRQQVKTPERKVMFEKILKVLEVKGFDPEFGMFLFRLMKGFQPKYFLTDLMGSEEWENVCSTYGKFIL